MAVAPSDLTNQSASPTLPDWFPGWARELAQQYFSGTTCMFVLHGNVHDLIRVPEEDGAEAHYCNLVEFLATQVFGGWDSVLSHDLSRGVRPQAGADAARRREMIQYLAGRWGEPAAWPRETDKILSTLEALIEWNLLEEPETRKEIAVLFEYAQFLVAASDLDTLARGYAPRLVRLLSWAQNPLIRRANIAFCLVVDKLAELNDRLTSSPYVALIEVPLPTTEERRGLIESRTKGQDVGLLSDFSPQQLAEMSNGLSLVNLSVVLGQAGQSGRRIDHARFRELKKSMIERQCQNLIEFIEPAHTLDQLVGQVEAKRRLLEDARWISEGKLDTAPMGYLICGPVGTGKTFLAECYAGSIGIPCAVLKNFRSKYVGETEGNLQHVLTVLRSLGPVVVIVDEADAALGNREADGDSGTSARVFSMIASQMGNTRYRGKIVWMLLTSRPDLLPIDLKRQGRAEVHIPLFYPQQEDEVREMFRVMAGKNRIALSNDALGLMSEDRRLSGADIESVVLGAKRLAMSAGRSEVTQSDVEQSLAEFIPSAQGLEKELQELAAVLEATQLSFLPQSWREKVQEPEGRTHLQERMVAIRQLIEE
jgi:ATP-dependent 26S proteasome regulatory subunit